MASFHGRQESSATLKTGRAIVKVGLPCGPAIAASRWYMDERHGERPGRAIEGYGGLRRSCPGRLRGRASAGPDQKPGVNSSPWPLNCRSNS